MSLEVTNKNFEELINTEGKVVLVDFWAEWCSSCLMLNPIIEQLSDDYVDEALIGKVNAEKNEELSSKLGVRNLPTMLIFKDGDLVDRIVGAKPKDEIKSKIDSYIT